MEDEIHQAVVIDNNSLNCRIGFAGEELPKSIFPTVIGRPKIKRKDDEDEEVWKRCDKYRDSFVGNEAQEKREILNLEHPIERGIIKNCEGIQKIWHHAYYNELRIAPEEYPVLHTDAPLASSSDREKMAEIMFEIFWSPSMYIENQSLLSMYSCGHNAGIVVSLGGGISNIVPIFEGNSIKNSSKRIELSGCDLTNYMNKLLNEQNQHQQHQQVSSEISNDIKEKLSFISLNYEEELKNSINSTQLEKGYQLPDGQILTISNERFKCPELLFQPSLFELEYQGIHELIFNTIISTGDTYIRNQFYNNILLVGGTSKIPGLKERLEKELRLLAPNNTKINIRNPSDCSNTSWIGGSILASLSTFQQMWITKEEYEENGASVIHKKCDTNQV